MNPDVRSVKIRALADALKEAEAHRDALAVLQSPTDTLARERALREYNMAWEAAHRAREALRAALDDEAKS